MTLAIHLEIGHDASLRTKTTPEGFTHDWEVFVRGCGGAEIHHYIEKVVFHLHETFPKPRRVVKEPPFSLRTSGYAGFTLPIEIYLKNNQEPKKIWFNYELVLQPSGPPIHNVQKEKYVFHNASDEFKSRLLKGGALSSSTGNSQDNTSSSNKVDDRNQMTSKPRLSGSDVVKKHKMKLDEPKNSDFLNLFGPPITKTSKSVESVKPKDPSKPIPKPENKGDKEKEKSDKSKSVKSSHKDREKDKEKSKDRLSENNEKKTKEEKKKSKDDKSKERERSKDKSKKEREKERERSPRLPSHSPSPKRSPKRSSSPPPAPQKVAPIKEKEYYKDEKKDKEKEEKRDKKEEKKIKKDKRDHKDKDKHKDRDKEKEHKEHKNKEIKSAKEISNFKTKDVSPVVVPPTSSQVVNKVEKKEKSKEKEPLKESPKEEEKIERNRTEKSEDKSQKTHKHKKKDKKEKREERHTKSDKKSEKQSNSTNKFKDLLKEAAVPTISNRESDKSNLFGSPKSEPPSTPDQENHKTTNSVDDYSIESNRGSSREHSPVPKAPSRSPSPMEVEPIKKPEPEKVKVKEYSPKKKEKKEKKKDKKTDKDHEKKRKRKNENISQEVEEPSEKVMKEEENNNSDDESKVSSTEDINPIPKSECDMDVLRELQHKIMSLKDNADLQRVVQLIAETGQYEVSANTFDFDLCLLDKSTVRQLQDFFSTVS